MGIYLPEVDALILELPRTGTTWMRHALSVCDIPWKDATLRTGVRCCPRHVPASCYIPAHRVACVVRNPLDWYRSYWAFHAPCGGLAFEPGLWYPHRCLHSTLGTVEPSLERWLDRVLSDCPGVYTRLLEMFVGPLGRQTVDTVIRHERLPLHFGQFLRSLGYDVHQRELSELERVNGSQVAARLTWEQKRLIHWLDRPTFARWYA